MKHVFVIHSNTVLLSALGAIEYEKIPQDKIIFLYGRNFKSSIVTDNIKTIDVSLMYKIGFESGFSRSKKNQHSLLEKVDKLINDNVADFYTVYVPHTGIPFFQALATNFRCSEICLLQEGAYSFFKKVLTNPIKVKILNVLFSNDRLWWQVNWSIPNFKSEKVKVSKTYSLDTSLFESLQDANNIRISWPKMNAKPNEIEDGAQVYLFESAVELGYIEHDVYMEGCKKLINDTARTKCFIKFHPNQSESNKNEILNMFSHYEVTELTDSIPFEIVMSSVRDLQLYGFSTSLLKFGKDLGHKVTSYSEYLCNHSLRFKKYYETFH